MGPQKLSRRTFIRIGIAGGVILFNPLGSWDGLADQESCLQIAGKKIRWIVPYSPGGAYDLYSRLIEPFYEKKIGAEIVVENITGAGSIIGSKVLKEAKADGLTLGILDAAGLLGAVLTQEPGVPNPIEDFTILGRVVRNQQVWATGANSPFRTFDDVLEEANKKAILLGITDVGGTSFVNIAISSFLLGIQPEFVTGFKGSRGSSLAAIRGEVDCVALTFESILDRIEAGDLRPLLQISEEPIASHPSLGVPLLGGEQGLAVRRARELGRNVEEAKTDTKALVSLIGAGRLIAAPPGLEESLFRCLEQGLYATLTDSSFIVAAVTAKRSLEVARAEEVRMDLQTAIARAEKFIPIIQEALKKVRG